MSVIHAMERLRRPTVRPGEVRKEVHKTTCGIPLIELGPREYDIDFDNVTCEECRRRVEESIKRHERGA